VAARALQGGLVTNAISGLDLRVDQFVELDFAAVGHAP
jgi:hypothetical protein